MVNSLSDVWAMDSRIGLWSPEANRHRLTGLRGFFVDKFGVADATNGGLTLLEVFRRKNVARIEKACVLATKCGRATAALGCRWATQMRRF